MIIDIDVYTVYRQRSEITALQMFSNKPIISGE